MPFARKQKELDAEDAVELTIKERKPFWHESPPLFSAAEKKGVTSLYPLSDSFTEKTWLIYAVDQTDVSGEIAFEFIKEWFNRYNEFGLETILVIRTLYKPWLQKRTIERFMEIQKLKFPLVLDNDNQIGKALPGDSFPKFTLISKGEILFHTSGPNWHETIELELHDFLRKSDPGLPLAEPYRVAEIPEQIDSWECGKGRGSQIVQRATLMKNADGSLDQEWSKKLEPKMFALDGEWEQDGESVFTKDSKASISFISEAPNVSILAQTLAKGGEMCKSIVELEGLPAIDVFQARDLKYDERGQSHIEIRTLQLRHVLKAMTESEREVTLRFPFAKQTPIAIYGVRFSK